MGCGSTGNRDFLWGGWKRRGTGRTGTGDIPSGNMGSGLLGEVQRRTEAIEDEPRI